MQNIIDHATSMRKQRHKYLHSTFEAAHLSLTSTCGARLHRDTPSPATTKSVIKTQPAFLNAQQVECSRSTSFAGSSNAKALTNSTTASNLFKLVEYSGYFRCKGVVVCAYVRISHKTFFSPWNSSLTMLSSCNLAVWPCATCLAQDIVTRPDSE